MFSYFLSDERHEMDDVIGRSREFFTELWILRRDTNRTRIEMTSTHHDTSDGDERSCRKPILIRSEHRGEDDVATSQ